MASAEDEEYWMTKYAEASCYVHGETMEWDEVDGEWYCNYEIETGEECE